MKHPDEGMVHAWLDDALDEPDARELEAHVATCAECAAMVAEARGLIAASSRIVSQLDGVPARVLPPVATRSVAAVRAARSWWRSPGVAAAALFCVTTATWIAVRRTPSVRDTIAPAAMAPAPAPTTTLKGDSQADARVRSRDVAAEAQASVAAAKPQYEVRMAAQKRETPDEAKFSRQLDSSRAQLRGVGSAAAAAADASTNATAPVPPATASRSAPTDSLTKKLTERFRSSNVQLQGVVAAAADARAEAAPALAAVTAPPATGAPLALVGCYQLVPVLQMGEGLAMPKSPPSRAMAGAAMAAAPAPSTTLQTLRLTESLSVAPSVMDARKAQDRAALRDTPASYVGRVSGSSNTDAVRWTAIAPGLVSVTRADGRTTLVRIAADSTKIIVGAGRVEFTARRMSCP